MKKISSFIPLIFFVVLVVCCWNAFNGGFRLLPSPLIGKPVPAFSLDNVLKPGGHLTQAIFQGRPSVLHVFATWCSICHEEHPMLIDFEKKYHVRMIGIDYKDDRSQVITWLNQYGNPFDAIIFDPEGSLSINLGVYGTPETFLIDSHGIIRKKMIGALSQSDWDGLSAELASYDKS